MSITATVGAMDPLGDTSVNTVDDLSFSLQSLFAHSKKSKNKGVETSFVKKRQDGMPEKLEDAHNASSNDVGPSTNKYGAKLDSLLRVTEGSGRVYYWVIWQDGTREVVPAREIRNHVTEEELQKYEHNCFSTGQNMETFYDHGEESGGYNGGTHKSLITLAKRRLKKLQRDAASAKASPELESGDEQKSGSDTVMKGADEDIRRTILHTRTTGLAAATDPSVDETGSEIKESSSRDPVLAPLIGTKQADLLSYFPTKEGTSLKRTKSVNDLNSESTKRRRNMDINETVRVYSDPEDEEWSLYNDPQKPTSRPSTLRQNPSPAKIPKLALEPGTNNTVERAPTPQKRLRQATVSGPPSKRQNSGRTRKKFEKGKQAESFAYAIEPSAGEQPEDVYDVEAIRGHRTREGNDEFLIKWQGWGEEDNTWEPMDHLTSSLELVEAYMIAVEQPLGNAGPSNWLGSA